MSEPPPTSPPTLSYPSPVNAPARFWPEFRQGLTAFTLTSVLFIGWALLVPESLDFCGVLYPLSFLLLYLVFFIKGLARTFRRPHRPGYLTGYLAAATGCTLVLLLLLLLSHLIR